MTDTAPPTPPVCENCGNATGDWDGLCSLCYQIACGDELSTYWLEDVPPDPGAVEGTE